MTCRANEPRWMVFDTGAGVSSMAQDSSGGPGRVLRPDQRADGFRQRTAASQRLEIGGSAAHRPPRRAVPASLRTVSLQRGRRKRTLGRSAVPWADRTPASRSGQHDEQGRFAARTIPSGAAAGAAVARGRAVKSDAPRGHQHAEAVAREHWVPFFHNDSIHFFYSLSPPVVLRVLADPPGADLSKGIRTELVSAASETVCWRYGVMHCGTPAVFDAAIGG